MKMNDKIYASIEHMKKNFDTAINNGYTSALSIRNKSLLLKVYNLLKGRNDEEFKNCHCANCLIKMLKLVGKHFFSFKQKGGNVDEFAVRHNIEERELNAENSNGDEQDKIEEVLGTDMGTDFDKCSE